MFYIQKTDQKQVINEQEKAFIFKNKDIRTIKIVLNIKNRAKTQDISRIICDCHFKSILKKINTCK